MQSRFRTSLSLHNRAGRAAVVCATAFCCLLTPECSAAFDVAQHAVAIASIALYVNPTVASAHELEESDDDLFVPTIQQQQYNFDTGTDSKHEEGLDFSRDSSSGTKGDHTSLPESRSTATTRTIAPQEWKTVQPTPGLLWWLSTWVTSHISDRDRKVWALYWIEAVASMLTLIVGWHCYWGVRANRQTACDWLDDTLPFLKTQFAKVGFETSYLQASSWSSFVFFATGRINCRSFIATLEITPRQCFWMYQLIGRVIPSLVEDQLVVEIPLDKMELSAFAIGRRIHLTRLKRTCQLLDDSCSIRTVAGMPQSLVVLSDNVEITERILTPEFVKMLAPREHLLKHLIIADTLATEHFPKEVPAIHVRLALPSDRLERREALVLLQCIVSSFIDTVSCFKLSERALKEVKKNRLELEKKVLRDAEADRAEQVELKRAKQKKEEEERLERMTPEQVRKWDEKQHKKSLKQRGPKIKMIS